MVANSVKELSIGADKSVDVEFDVGMGVNEILASSVESYKAMV